MFGGRAKGSTTRTPPLLGKIGKARRESREVVLPVVFSKCAHSANGDGRYSRRADVALNYRVHTVLLSLFIRS